MKILILSFTAAILLTACDSNKKDKETAVQTDSTGNKKTGDAGAEASLVGKWKPVEMNLKGMSEEEKKSMVENIRLEFTASGQYFGINRENKQEGTYTYDPKTKTLDVVNGFNTSEVEHFTIGWEDELLLMTNNEGTVKLRREN
jgi:hypothetical protein